MKPRRNTQDCRECYAIPVSTNALQQPNEGDRYPVTWTQVYDPVGHWWLSTIIAALPIIVLLGLLAGLKVRAHLCAVAGAATAVIVAIVAFKMPALLAVSKAKYDASNPNKGLTNSVPDPGNPPAQDPPQNPPLHTVLASRYWVAPSLKNAPEKSTETLRAVASVS